MNVLYCIKHITYPIVYYGISNNPLRRFAEHKNDCSNKALREYFSIYGTDSFEFSILASEADRALVEELEELVISEAKSLSRLFVCNVLVGSVFTGDSSQIGERHWNAKFTEQDILDIRSIYAMGGITQKQIGEIYGVSNKVISSITSGHRWNKAEGVVTKNSKSNKVANRRKLTDIQVVDIRILTKNTYESTGTISILDISTKYGVSKQSMSGMLKGMYYKNLPGPLLGIDYFHKFGKHND